MLVARIAVIVLNGGHVRAGNSSIRSAIGDETHRIDEIRLGVVVGTDECNVDALLGIHIIHDLGLRPQLVRGTAIA